MTDSDNRTDRGSKIDPESLVLRGRPRRVARFNRRVVIAVAAGGCAFVFIATMVALYPPSLHHRQSGDELLGANPKSVADGLAGLPKSYGDLKPAPPKLGPPLPGDLGPPVTHVEHNLGIQPENGLRPNPEEDAERAERMRLARQAQEAQESKIFFPVSMRPGDVLAGIAGAGTGQGAAAQGTRAHGNEFRLTVRGRDFAGAG